MVKICYNKEDVKQQKERMLTEMKNCFKKANLIVVLSVFLIVVLFLFK